MLIFKGVSFCNKISPFAKRFGQKQQGLRKSIVNVDDYLCVANIMILIMEIIYGFLKLLLFIFKFH
jgi:hypothetical protein